MGRKYQIRDSDRLYFVTFTIVEWIRVFDIEANINIVLESIKFCQQHKGLEIYAWVIMPNHLHLIIGRNGEQNLSQIIRDLKGYTSREIKKSLEKNSGSLMYQILEQSGTLNSRNKNFQLWQQHNHPIEMSTDFMFDQRVNYIHANPVKAELVTFPEEWKWSSAIDFNEGQGLLELAWT